MTGGGKFQGGNNQPPSFFKKNSKAYPKRAKSGSYSIVWDVTLSFDRERECPDTEKRHGDEVTRDGCRNRFSIGENGSGNGEGLALNQVRNVGSGGGGEHCP